MNDYEHRTGFAAILLVALVMIAVGIFGPRAEAASVAEQAHLALAPRAPFVRTDWTLDLGTSNVTATTRAWIYKLDCRTGAVTNVYGMTVQPVTWHGTILVSSGPLQVFAGDCLLPAGNASIGPQTVSTIGPLYRFPGRP